MSFANMWSSVNEEQEKAIWAEFGMDITLLVVSLVILSLAIHYDPKGCGIALREWLMVFCVLYFSRSTFQVVKIWVVHNAA